MLLWLLTARAHIPILYVFGPEDDWCGFLNQEVDVDGVRFYPGDVVILEPGDYGPCAFEALVTDSDTEFTILQSQSPENPARFRHEGPGAILDVTGTHLFLIQLEFPELASDQVGVRVSDAHQTWVRFNRFDDVAGTALDIDGSASDLWVLDNHIALAGGTGVALGCEGCVQSARVRNNLFEGAGWGVTALAGVTADITDDVFTGGSAIRSDGDLTVSGSLVVDAEAGIVATGTISVANSIIDADVALDAGEASVEVLGTTIARGTVAIPADARAFDNAGLGAPDASNVPCESGCLRDPGAWDFYPLEPLRGTGAGALDTDFCGRQRTEPFTSGAIQFVGEEGWEPFDLRLKNDFACVIGPLPGVPEDTGFQETGEVTNRTCQCRSAGPGAAFLLLLISSAAALMRRRDVEPV